MKTTIKFMALTALLCASSVWGATTHSEDETITSISGDNVFNGSNKTITFETAKDTTATGWLSVEGNDDNPVIFKGKDDSDDYGYTIDGHTYVAGGGGSGSLRIASGTYTFKNILYFGQNANNTAKLFIDGGIFDASATNLRLGQSSSTTCVYEQTGGTNKVSTLGLGYGANSKSDATISGGLVDVGYDFVMSEGSGAESTFVLDGTGEVKLNTSHWAYVGHNATGKADITVKGNGKLEGTTRFKLADTAGSQATLTVEENGTVAPNNEFYVGENGYGKLSVKGGTFNSKAGFSVGMGSSATGIVEIAGGTLNATNRSAGGFFDVATVSGGVGKILVSDGQLYAAYIHLGCAKNTETEMTVSGGIVDMNNTYSHDSKQACHIRVGGAWDINTDVEGSSAKYTQTKGSVVVHDFCVADGLNSKGEAVITGGTLTANGEFRLANKAGANGTMTISNATVNVYGWVCIGRDGTNRTGRLTIDKDGVLRHYDNNLNKNQFGIGNLAGDNSTNELVINDGGLAESHTDVRVGEGGSAILTINKGGRFRAATSSGGQRYILMNQDCTAYDTTINLNGGVLEAGRITTGADGSTTGTGTASLIFNGGTVRALASNSDLIKARADLTVTLGEAGGIIDTQAYAPTITATLGGTGGLTKLGSGTLTLSTAPTFTGALCVKEGKVICPSKITNLWNTKETQNGGNYEYTPNDGFIILIADSEEAAKARLQLPSDALAAGQTLEYFDIEASSDGTTWTVTPSLKDSTKAAIADAAVSASNVELGFTAKKGLYYAIETSNSATSSYTPGNYTQATENGTLSLSAALDTLLSTSNVAYFKIVTSNTGN